MKWMLTVGGSSTLVLDQVVGELVVLVLDVVIIVVHVLAFILAEVVILLHALLQLVLVSA